MRARELTAAWSFGATELIGNPGHTCSVCVSDPVARRRIQNGWWQIEVAPSPCHDGHA